MRVDQRAITAFSTFAAAPCGDVGAARDCATALLVDHGVPAGDRARSRLLHTAALIHLQAAPGVEPTPEALIDFLTRVQSDGADRRQFACSPSSLVRYVAAELSAGEFDGLLFKRSAGHGDPVVDPIGRRIPSRAA